MAIPLYESVLSSMRDKISSRDWVAGDLIPREVDLCKQYGVSRSTIRMAMSRLVEEGLLTRVKGVGTYVSSEVHLQDTTLFINSFAQDLEKRGLIPCTELLSFRTVPAIPEINEKLALAPDARLLQMTRLRYPKDAFATGPLVLTTSHFRADFLEFFQNYDLETTPLYKVLKENGYVRTIFDKHLSAQALTDRQCHLMGVDSGSLAIAITSTAWDQKQFPLEYTISLYPIAKNEFELKLKA